MPMDGTTVGDAQYTMKGYWKRFKSPFTMIFYENIKIIASSWHNKILQRRQNPKELKSVKSLIMVKKREMT